MGWQVYTIARMAKRLSSPPTASVSQDYGTGMNVRPTPLAKKMNTLLVLVHPNREKAFTVKKTFTGLELVPAKFSKENDIKSFQ